MAKLMDDDESEREKYTSFCAHIAATEMEVWVEEVFAGVDLRRHDADGEITLYDFELLEGREGSSSVRRLFEVVDCIDQDGSITMQEWVQFLANLWHFGGDDLVESTLTNFENLISFRENAEIEAMERAPARGRGGPAVGAADGDRYTEAASIGLYERMDAVFEGMDFDGNGTIEKEELAELIQDDEVSAEIMPLLDNIDEDDTITRRTLPKGGVAKNRSPLTSPRSPGAAARPVGDAPERRGRRERRRSLPTLSIGEASAAALKAALGSARSSVNPTPRSSSTPRTARVTPRRMFSRSNAGSMYTPFHARSSPRHKKKAADKAGAKAGS
ncbi:hypothetical protein SO694_00131032 [Aureococcus anophagefferens]|uniref:EF-hand domain-containing protein n=1 Tax=Aureococcus anophagefferens TaxID=44056 RepID=A0ABR1GF73_AURAN